MGFSVYWIAVKGISKANVLTRLKFRETDEVDEWNEAPFSWSEIATGWIIITSNENDSLFLESATALSLGAELLLCQVEESAMYSTISYFENGREVWNVTHNGQESISDLSVQGTPPPACAEIEENLTNQQKQDATGSVDYLFDLPIELAARITGYRHDQIQFTWGHPTFTIIEPLSV